ncbi:hypothetical protein DL768_009724 [Monosporascus sp. mg162]|nr:hypothetical protein DL768_009724 [Monosporascus sp. mg162]
MASIPPHSLKLEIKATGHIAGTSTYASYAELVADPEVAIVYVATSQGHHFQNVMLALEANKHVLCEKAFTVTAAQARRVVDTARAWNLFLMEAVWTRFFPLSARVRELVSPGAIGTVCRVIADSSINRSLPDDPPSPAARGGKEVPAVVTAAMNKYHTSVDETTSFIVQFPRHKAMGIVMTTMRVGSGVDYDFTGGPAIKIQGSEGEIQDSGRGGWGRGLYWEADECTRCLRDGRLESDVLPLEETVVTMEVMETALRQGGVRYPELITSDVYDPRSPLNTGEA